MSDELIKFSIIVPIYNVEKYLERCINSIINQTYNNLEIILVDDESPDNCPVICDEYAKKDNRVKVVHKKNGGLSDARNSGMDIATGDYIVFVDSDDYIELDACAKFLHFAKKGCDILVGDAIVTGGTCNLQHIINSDVLTGKQYLLEAYRAHKAPMAAWLNVYKRQFLSENKLFFTKGILHEDEDFTPRCFLKAKTIVCTNIYFYHYIIRENSITTVADKRKNANDLYDTCLRLYTIYNKIDNPELRKHLENSLSVKYLNLFQAGKLHQYGNEYLHKKFVIRNAHDVRTFMKAVLYCISPKFYYLLNKNLKCYLSSKKGKDI